MHTLITLVFACLFSISGVAHAQVGIDLGGGVTGSVGGSEVEVSADATSSDSDTPVSDDETPQSGTSFSLTRDQAASASLDAESAELGSASVSTSEDLSRYATSKMKRDDNIESIDVGTDGISFEYRKDARFLGFIPGHITATADVSSDGTVDIDYPWYRFLIAVKGSGDTEADLQARVDGLMEGVGAGFNARVEAEIIEAIHLAFQGVVATNAGSAATADMAGSADVYPN